MIEHIDTIVLFGLLSVAVWTDQRSHRIPNLLVIAILLCGVALQTVLHGLTGLSEAGFGVVTGFCVFIFPYLRGGMAAGDVKLIAATGSFIGPVPVLVAGGIALIAGALFAGSLLAYQHYRGASVTATQMLTTKFPFAMSIALGVASVVLIQGTL